MPSRNVSSVREWLSQSSHFDRFSPSGRLISILSVIGGLLLWEWFARTAPGTLLAPPTEVALKWLELMMSGVLPTNLLNSLKHTTLGYFFSIITAIPLAFAMGQLKIVRRAISPYVDAIYSTPVVAYIPLIIVWFGLGFNARVFLVFLFCFFEILIDTYEGIGSIGAEYYDAAKSFNLSSWQTQTKVVFPASLPFIFAGLRLGVGRAVRGMIVAELFLALVNLGELISGASAQFNTDLQLAVIITISLLGVVSQAGVKYIERRALPWKFESDRTSSNIGIVRSFERRFGNLFFGTLASVRSVFNRVGSSLAGLLAAFSVVLSITKGVGSWIASLPRTKRAIVIHGGMLVIVALSWELVGRALGPVLFAPLSLIIPTYIDLALNGPMFPTLIASLQEMMVAFGLATAVGLPLGFIMGRSKIAEDVFDPWVSAAFVTSTSATLPLIIIFFGTGYIFRLWIIWFGTVFYMVLNVYQGANKVDSMYTDVAKSFDASTLKTYRKIIFPATFPYVVASLRIGLARSIRGLILAETFIYVGYGGLIGTYGKSSITTTPVLALIITLMILGYVLRKGLEELQYIAMPWARHIEGDGH